MIAPGRDARRAAARLCLVDFPGRSPTARVERLIADDHLAGVVLFRKNVAGGPQVAALTAALRRVAHGARASLPWIAIDHEGGAVDRFAPDDADRTDAGRGARQHASDDASRDDSASGGEPRPTRLPSAMALGAAGDPELAHAAGGVAGRELRALGINLNFAPVMDVNTDPANPIIGARAFGDAPPLVTAMGVAYLRGLQAEGVAATAKHFPGHGGVAVDSHVALPVVADARDRLEAVALPPFRAAVRAAVAAVMTAHVVVPALDPTGRPATMSAPVLTELLRTGWGYSGLVCSDALGMRAVTDHTGPGEAAVAAVAAGCDLLLALGPDAMQDEILDGLARAVERGALPAARVAEALARVEAAAARWVAGGPPPPPPADLEAAIGTEAHRRLAARIAEAAVTLVRDPGVLPLARSPIDVVAASPEAPAEALAAALRRHGGRARSRAAADAGASGHVVVVTRSRGPLVPDAVAVVREVAARTRGAMALVATGDPYDVAQAPREAAALATYGTDPASLDAAARVLLGLLRSVGRLPVALPAATSGPASETVRP
ncbi:MAG: glycoside hydrolase family 3 N-terminal domain-containing protein [Armatimonadota bacterium]|nr:glycoside hydrolase family 3 N-terminal domain-containing protein [Armatimonadota bacterium]MDR7453556.1 glycoside hydrolase family 3 N-terminal domain-containing protein [Armatimonadota bacterium]MDR7455694.1 glycoside hydrolase family 3 N-terminal domain-containing protein [Armatimonadota bacterium]